MSANVVLAKETNPRRKAGYRIGFLHGPRGCRDLYFSGTTSMFLLHGAVQDLVRSGKEPGYGALADFLAEQIFGRWELVLHYDLARGLRPFAGRDGARLKEMVVLANRRVGDLAAARKDPATAIALLDRFVQNNIMVAEGERLSAAIIIDHASFLVPSGDAGRSERCLRRRIW